MSIPHARAGERGASILAGLVLVAMLGAAAVGIGASNSSPPASQVATTHTTLDDNGLKQGVQVKCGDRTVTVNYACVQKARAVDIKKLQQKCSPGFSYKITEDKRTATVFVTPTPIIQDPCANTAPPQTCKSGGTAIPALVSSFVQCTVSFCPPGGGECQPLGSVEAGKDLGIADKRVAGILQSLKDTPTPQAAQKLLGSINGDDTLQAALKQREAEVKAAVEGTAVAAQEADQTARRLNEFASACTEAQTGECYKALVDAQKATDAATMARAEAAAAAAEYKKLADAKVTLTPPQQTPGNPDDPTRTTPPCTSNCGPSGPQQPPGQQPPGQQTGFNPSSFLKSLMGQGGQQPRPGNQTPQAPGTCAAGQLICSGNTLYSRNNQCVDTVAQICPNGCSGNTCVQQGQNCPAAPAQPDPSGCQAGTWRPTYNGACVSGWQCTSGSGQFAAQISCQPQVADVGMSLAISYSCSSGTSAGSGFQTNGAQSGSATVTIANPPNNTNTATYGLTCTNQNQTASAQCTVQVGRPSIILIANPKAVATSTASRLGWVTSGMQSCVISSPDLPAFTLQNANNTSVNGTATTPPLNSAARFLLHCTTVGGGTRQASTTVSIIGVPDTFTDTPSGSVTVSSTADATTIGHGATTTITWTTQNAPSGSAISLWVFDVLLGQSTVLIADARAPNGAFLWRIPDLTDPCDTNSSIACGSDLVTGRKYVIEAALYTPADAYLGNGAPPSNPVDPTYLDFGFGDPFTMGN